MFIGGVEVAIARSYRKLNESVDYRIYYVRKRGSMEYGQRHVLSLFRSILTGSWRPNVVVTSLWWSHPFGALLKRSGAIWIAFFHNCGFTGGLQRLILCSAWRRADSRLVDSQATGVYYRAIFENNYRIVPYIFPEQTGSPDWLSRKYDFVWVGRRVSAKRADLAAAFMRQIAGVKQDGRLCVIASGDVPEEFFDLDLGPGWEISVRQSLEGNEVRAVLRESRFFLLTSDFEGMSMVTVESIFAGCVPVVRLVGELRNYIGEGYELAISEDTMTGLAATADKVVERWKDSAFATTAVKPILERIEAYSTYEQEFLSAVTNAFRGARE
jgi:glycosyltransferase involved in cell wall biosynthesis